MNGYDTINSAYLLFLHCFDWKVVLEICKFVGDDEKERKKRRKEEKSEYQQPVGRWWGFKFRGANPPNLKDFIVYMFLKELYFITF